MIDLATSGQKLRVQIPLNTSTLAKLRAVPADKAWSDRILLVKITTEALIYLRDNFPDVEWSPAAKEKLTEAETKIRALEEAKERRRMLVLDGEYPFANPPPFKHQKTVFFLSRDSEYFAVFAEQGTGKSRTMVDTAGYLYEKKKIDSMLILAPNGVHRNWIEQFEIFFRKDLPYKANFYSADAKAAHQAEIEELIKYKKGLRVVSVNVESISHDSGLKFVMRFMKGRKVLVVVDESQRIKSPSSKRGKNALKIAKAAPYRRILTGTPVTNGLEDLFNQMKFLDPTILGCDTFTEFKTLYCTMGGFGQKEIVGYKNVDQLQERIAPHSFHIAKKDCLDLPDKVYVKVPVELTDEQRRLYREIKTQFLAELNAPGHTITAPLALTRLLRLHQIVCGHYSPDETEEVRKGTWFPLANNRIRTAVELVEEARSKVIIWSRFLPDIQQLKEALTKVGIGCVTYCGLDNRDTRFENLRDFKTNPKTKVFLGTQMAGGVGLTINEAKTTIYYANSFSLEDRLQSEDRNHRAGQDESVTYYDLYSPATIDSKILAALKKKQEVANLVKSLDGIRAMLEEVEDGSLFE